MAWALRSKSGVTSAASGNLTLTEPTGAAQNDLLVAFIGYRDSAAFTLPAGWSLVATQQSTGDLDATSGIGSGVMAYIVRGASAPDYAFTRTLGDIAQGYVLCFTGNATAGVYDTGNATTGGSIVAGGSVPGITTANANELLVAGFSGGDNTGATSAWTAATDPTTGWTEEGISSTNTGADNTTSVAWNTKSTAGSTGTVSVTTTGTSRAVMVVGAFVAETLAAITGTLASTETGSDTASVTGDVIVSGALSATESGADTASFSGTVADSTGTLYYVIYPSAQAAPSAAQVKLGQDVTSSPATASGNETSPGTSQTFTFTSPATGLTASTSYRVAIVWTDGTNDSNVSVSDAWSTLADTVTGTLAATESGSDTAAFTASLIVSGALSVSETGSDTAALTGTVRVSGTLASTEAGADTASLIGTVLVSGSLAATETGNDTAFFNGSSVIIATGSLAATETGSDTAAFAGDVYVSGTIAATESGADTAAIAGNVYVSGLLAATESGADIAAFSGTAAAPITGTLAAIETGQDTAAFSGPVTAHRTGGGKGSVSVKPAKRQKLIIVEQIDDVEELVEQVKEIIKTEPRKKLAAKVKKPTQTLQESPQAAFDWIGYYQTQLDALRDQQRAESLKQQLARNAQIIQSILEKQDNTAILAVQEAEYARLREEEDFLLLLMAA